VIRRWRELHALAEEVGVVDRRDPAWWFVLGGSALLEAIAQATDADAPYVASDGEPHGDTFMGWPAAAPRDLAGAIGAMVADAAAASRAIVELDGTLPEQPLAVAIRAGGGARTEAVDPANARFAIGGKRFAARVSGGPDELAAVARAIARQVRDGGGGEPVPAAIGAVAGEHEVAIARHLHRRAWTDGSGPWLGLGWAPQLAVASTCHLVVDGYGHALLASRIAQARHDMPLRAHLAAAAAEIIGTSPIPRPPPLAGTEPLGVAWARLPHPLPRFAEMVHALGRVLHDEAGARGPFSPVIQVPVARGAKDDPLRWRRRVVYALLSVRFPDNIAEPVDAFAERARATIAREVDGGGLLTRLVGATAAIPIPMALKRRRVAGARDPRWNGPLELLAGRASFSLIRFQPGDAPPPPPLVAVSAPGLVLPSDENRSTSVLTLVADAHGTTATLCGTGLAGTHAGAQELLQRWTISGTSSSARERAR
jgi:hypothetical protein